MTTQLLTGKRILMIATAVIILNFPTFFFFLDRLAVDPSLFASAFFVVIAVTLGLITSFELGKIERAALQPAPELCPQTRPIANSLPTLPAAAS